MNGDITLHDTHVLTTPYIVLYLMYTICILKSKNGVPI